MAAVEAAEVEVAEVMAAGVAAAAVVVEGVVVTRVTEDRQTQNRQTPRNPADHNLTATPTAVRPMPEELNSQTRPRTHKILEIQDHLKARMMARALVQVLDPALISPR